MDIPYWVLDPFSNVITAESSQLKEELLELTTNEEIKLNIRMAIKNFGCKNQSYVQVYPGLWSIVKCFLIEFLSSYLSERGLSAVATLLTKKGNRLLVIKRGNLRLFLSQFEPNINKLVNLHQNHQIRPSR